MSTRAERASRRAAQEMGAAASKEEEKPEKEPVKEEEKPKEEKAVKEEESPVKEGEDKPDDAKDKEEEEEGGEPPKAASSLLEAAEGLTSLSPAPAPKEGDGKEKPPATKEEEAKTDVKKEEAKSPKKEDEPTKPPPAKVPSTQAYEREMALRAARMPYGGMGMDPTSGMFNPMAAAGGMDGSGYPGMASGYPSMAGMGRGGMDPMHTPYGSMYNPYLGGMGSMPLPTPHQVRAMGGGQLPTPHEVKTMAGNAKNFPETLYDIINTQRFNHIVAWLPHGKGFMIHEKQLFSKTILPAYFDGAKFTSFTRRLKRWRFERVPRGPELGAYYNKHFMRDRPDLVRQMVYHPSDEDPKAGATEGEETEKDATKTDDKEKKVDDDDKPLKPASKGKKARKRKQARYPNHEPAPMIPGTDPTMGGMAYNPAMMGFPPGLGAGGPDGPHKERRLEAWPPAMMGAAAGMGGMYGGPYLPPPGMGGGGPSQSGDPTGPPVVSSPGGMRMQELERRKRILEAERVLAQERGGMPSGVPPGGMGGMGGAPPAGGASAGGGADERPVMMSKAEEKEFAEYLMAKRGQAGYGGPTEL